VVEKIVPPSYASDTEKAQIVIEEAEHLYKEIRIENELQDGGGAKVKLKPDTEVDVTIEAPHDGVEQRTDADEK
jgi:hypothetical protein